MAKTRSESQKEYQKRTGYASLKKYEAERVLKITMRLNKDTDADIIALLNDEEAYATQVKRILREYLNK